MKESGEKKTSRRRGGRDGGVGKRVRIHAFRVRASSISIDWAHAGTYRCALGARHRRMHERKQAGTGARIGVWNLKISQRDFFFPSGASTKSLNSLLPRHGPGDLVSALRRKGRGIEELVKLLVEVGGGTAVGFRGKGGGGRERTRK